MISSFFYRQRGGLPPPPLSFLKVDYMEFIKLKNVDNAIIKEARKEYSQDCKDNWDTFNEILSLGNPKDLVFKELFVNSTKYITGRMTKKIKVKYDFRDY